MPQVGVESYVKSATLALVPSPHYPGNVDFSRLLKSHFATAKVIHVGDVITVSAQDDLAYVNQMNDVERVERAYWPTIYFKVVHVEGNGRLLDSKHCKLYLTGSAKSHLPAGSDHTQPSKAFPIVRRHFNALCRLLKPYLNGCSSDSPTIVLLSGSS